MHKIIDRNSAGNQTENRFSWVLPVLPSCYCACSERSIVYSAFSWTDIWDNFCYNVNHCRGWLLRIHFGEKMTFVSIAVCLSWNEHKRSSEPKKTFQSHFKTAKNIQSVGSMVFKAGSINVSAASNLTRILTQLLAQTFYSFGRNFSQVCQQKTLQAHTLVSAQNQF